MFLGEPVHWFVRDAGSAHAHHLDYEQPGFDRALCGHPFAEILEESEDRPRRVCRKCQGRMPAHEAKWWQAKAEHELERLAEVRSSLATARRALTRTTNRLSAQPGVSASATRLQVECEGLREQLRLAEHSTRELKAKVRNQRKELGRLQGAARSVTGVSTSARKRTPQRKRAAGSSAHPPVAGQGAKKRFYPREPAPLPAKVVRGGLPGLGKRR